MERMQRGDVRGVVSALFAIVSLVSCHPNTTNQKPIDLPPDLDGVAALHLLESKPEILRDPDASDLKEILDIGRRNLNWLTVINRARDPDRQLSLTSKDRAIAYPIEKPNIYNKDLVLSRFENLKGKLPSAMAAVLFGNQPLPNRPVLDDEEHAIWGFRIDVVYQSAVRWLTMKPYLSELAQRRKKDVRGFHHLNRDPKLAEKLARWSSLPLDEKTAFRNWLVDVCANTETRGKCQSDFAALEMSGGDVGGFWLRYSPKSSEIWKSFFQIAWQRNDIDWTPLDPNVASMPVLDPENENVSYVLKQNVEDEWKWPTANGLWQLQLHFEKGGDPAAMTHIEFVSGTTPHVIPPNKIVMNADQPTTEYEYRWALRHEYGHVLGFPDCYLEFYDIDQKAIVNYQLDTSDLMCSRRGVLKQNHYDEMRRVYYKDIQ